MIDFLKEYLVDEAGGFNIFGKITISIVYFLIALILVRLVSFITNRIIKSKLTNLRSVDSKRLKTVMSVLKSFANFVIFFTWFLTVLMLFGVNTSALLTTAGIGGIAISFGAKSVVEDIISGVFLMLEDSFAIGDYVRIADRDGEVEKIGLRTTTIRDFNGELHVIPNGEIKVVTNRNKNIQRALVKIPISYESDYKKAIEILNREYLKVNEDSAVIEPVTVWGITDFLGDGVIISAVCKTIPGEQWRIERLMRQIAIDEFLKEGIEILHNSLSIKVNKE